MSAAKNARKHQRRLERKAQNIQRALERVKLPPAEQLRRLDWRLGRGQGAVKERKRLHEQLKLGGAA